MAAHLHDSVLQTLALIQRSRRPAAGWCSLARAQERELRAWLYGARRPSWPSVRLAGAIDAMAGEVEDAPRSTVEVVVVGDAASTSGCAALVSAAREAVVNAAKHAGGDRGRRLRRGRADELVDGLRPRPRRGLRPGGRARATGTACAESIIGRMERHGGTREVRSAPGEGTEVRRCELPRSDA